MTCDCISKNFLYRVILSNDRFTKSKMTIVRKLQGNEFHRVSPLYSTVLFSVVKEVTTDFILFQVCTLSAKDNYSRSFLLRQISL